MWHIIQNKFEWWWAPLCWVVYYTDSCLHSLAHHGWHCRNRSVLVTVAFWIVPKFKFAVKPGMRYTLLDNIPDKYSHPEIVACSYFPFLWSERKLESQIWQWEKTMQEVLYMTFAFTKLSCTGKMGYLGLHFLARLLL